MAAGSLGVLLAEQGDVEGAKAAYQQAIDSGAPRGSTEGALNLGVLLRRQGDVDGAQAAYQQAIDSGHPEQAPKAAANLGLCSRSKGMSRAPRPPTSRPSTPATPSGAEGRGEPGAVLADQGDVEGAKAAYQQAIDSGTRCADGDEQPGGRYSTGWETLTALRPPTSRLSTPATLTQHRRPWPT